MLLPEKASWFTIRQGHLLEIYIECELIYKINIKAHRFIHTSGVPIAPEQQIEARLVRADRFES